MQMSLKYAFSSLAITSTLLLGWRLAAAQDGEQASTQGTAAQSPKPANSITVEIASPEHFHKRVISPDQPLAVVITNTSTQPQRIWRDWCSWGYQQLSFELKDTSGDGRTWTVRKKEHEFWKNYPDFWVIGVGEPLVLNVTLSSDIWEITGGPLADMRGKGFTVQAIFAAEPDDQSRENNVWSGRVTSTPRLYQIE